MDVPAAWNLTGRTALVTGAGSATGIGFATAVALGQLGAAVAMLVRYGLPRVDTVIS